MVGASRLVFLRILLALPVIFGGLVLGAMTDARMQMLLLSLVVAVMLSALFHFFGDKMLLRWYRAKELEDERLKRIVSELAMHAGMKSAPRLYIIDASSASGASDASDASDASRAAEQLQRESRKSSSRHSSSDDAGDDGSGRIGGGFFIHDEEDEREGARDAIPNAFSVGRDEEHASIVMTRALLDMLDESELKSVLAHEIAHIRRSEDLLIGTLIAVAAGMLTALATIAFWISIFMGSGCEDDPAPNAIRLFVMSLIAIPASVLIHLFVPAGRVYAADIESARMLGSARGLISAMDTIDNAIRSSIPSATDKVVDIINPAHAHLFFINPLRTETVVLLDWHLPSYYQLFNTHPSTSARRSLLSRMSGQQCDGVSKGEMMRDGDEIVMREASSSSAISSDQEEKRRSRMRKILKRAHANRRDARVAKPFLYSFISYMIVLFMLIAMDTFRRKDFDLERSAAIFIAYMFALLIFYIFAALVFRMRMGGCHRSSATSLIASR